VESSEPLAEIELLSASGFFSGEPATGLGGAGDVDTDSRIVKQMATGFNRLDLGTVAATGVLPSEVAKDLTIHARTVSGKMLTDVRVLSIPVVVSVKLVYNARDGSLVLETNSPLVSFDIRSASGILNGDPAKNLGGVDDIDTDLRIFKRDARGFRGIDLGNVISPGWDAALLNSDLTVTGILQDGSSAGPIAIEVIPDVFVTNVLYRSDGTIEVTSTEPLESLELISQWGVFDGKSAASSLGGPLDVDTDTRIFKHSVTGFTRVRFDQVAKAGLTNDFLKKDLVIRGARIGGGGLGRLVFVAEQTAIEVTVGIGLDGTFFVQSNVPLEGLDITTQSSMLSEKFLRDRDADDVATDKRIVKTSKRSFTSSHLGKIGKAGTPFQDWTNELTVKATLLGGQEVSNVYITPLFMILYYDDDSGELSLDAMETLTFWQINSKKNLFLGPRPRTVDVYDAGFVGKSTPTTAARTLDVQMGAILAPGLSREALLADLTFEGSSRTRPFTASRMPVAVISRRIPGGLIYDAATGNLSVDTNRPIQLLSIQSLSGIFTGQPAANLGGPEDLDSDGLLIKSNRNGFDDFSLGAVVATGLPQAFLKSDLLITGTTLDGGYFEELNLQVIPQENQATLIYDAASGEVKLETNFPIVELAVSLTSGRAFFRSNSNSAQLSGPEDVLTTTTLVKKDARGFRTLSFGRIAQSGVEAALLAGTIKATLLDGSVMTDISWVVIPEAAQTTITYDANTGAIVIDASVSLTTIELKSASSIFTGEPVAFPLLTFELDRDDKIFLLRPSGVTHLESLREPRPHYTPIVKTLNAARSNHKDLRIAVHVKHFKWERDGIAVENPTLRLQL
jgi:hypothetical protein